MIATRDTNPHAALVLGRPGAGATELMHAAAGRLVVRDSCARVFHIEAACAAAGAMMETDRDAALMALLDEMQEQPDALFLVDHLDLLLGTLISHALLTAALDRGVRMLATLKAPSVSVQRIGADDALRRRLSLFQLDDVKPAALMPALHRLAEVAGIEAEPQAIGATLRLSARSGEAQPGAAVSLMGAALATGRWQGRKVISPGDVVAADACESSRRNHRQDD
jgi:ATP-dependent Clp protease ATP-binding subunit ClpA